MPEIVRTLFGICDCLWLLHPSQSLSKNARCPSSHLDRTSASACCAPIGLLLPHACSIFVADNGVQCINNKASLAPAHALRNDAGQPVAAASSMLNTAHSPPLGSPAELATFTHVYPGASPLGTVTLISRNVSPAHGAAELHSTSTTARETIISQFGSKQRSKLKAKPQAVNPTDRRRARNPQLQARVCTLQRKVCAYLWSPVPSPSSSRM